MPGTVTASVTAVWRRIPGTLYEASSAGQVRRAARGQGTQPGRVLKPYPGGGRSGGVYLYVHLYDGKGGRKKRAVHACVAHAFLGRRPTRNHVVEHIDHNPHNNRLTNLKWITRPANWRSWYSRWMQQQEEAA